MKPAAFHGGNIYRASEELGIPEDKIMDFSASINPLGMPKRVMNEIKRSLKNLAHYPDPDVNALRLEIAKHHTISSESIVCGNGSTELISLIVKALQPKMVLIPVPTFSEYEKTLQRTGIKGEIAFFPLREKDTFDINPDRLISVLKSKPYGMVFLCNPNNPTGRLLRKEDVLKIAGAAKSLSIYLVVDEAFMDFAPKESVLQEVENNPYLIVLRSMTKFYALAGLRLGYGVFPKRIVNIVKQYKEPWTVNTLAQKAGIAALRDSIYEQETFRVFVQEKNFLETSFKKLGIRYIPSSTNYYLLRFSSAKHVSCQLKKNGILVRDCSDFRGLEHDSYIRMAVKTHKDNAYLLKVLSKCREA